MTSRFMIFLFASVLAIGFGTLASYCFADDANVSESDNSVLEAPKASQALLKEFREGETKLKPQERRKFYSSWELDFKAAVSRPTEDQSLRLKLIDAMGTAQIALGKKDEAFITYLRMEQDAQKAGDPDNQILAEDRQLDLSSGKPLDLVLKIAGRLEASAKQRADQRNDPVSRSQYAEILFRIGTSLAKRDVSEGHTKKSAPLLKAANAALKKCAAIPDAEKTPLATRMYWLAQTQSRLGLHSEAAETYGKILGMPSSMPRLWLEYLKICELSPKDGPEYQKAIVEALVDSAKRNAQDDFEITLRQKLGESYRNTKLFTKSNETLKPLIDKVTGPDLKSSLMLLVAQNYRDLNDLTSSRDLLDEVVRQYPKTIAGQTAPGELRKLIYLQVRKQKFWTKTITWSGVGIVAFASVIYIWRRKKK